MGYSRDSLNRLCCDSCGKAGGVRRRQCPHGYCPAWAACPACWNDPEKRTAWNTHHVDADCEGSSARFEAEQARVAELQAAGEYVFCASTYADSARETVKCWFRGVSGETKELVVSAALRETFGRETTHRAALGAVA